jgi:hypothetical protein
VTAPDIAVKACVAKGARERGPKIALACVDLRLIRPDKHSLEFANPIIDGTVNHSLRMWWRIASCFATFVRRP